MVSTETNANHFGMTIAEAIRINADLFYLKRLRLPSSARTSDRPISKDELEEPGQDGNILKDADEEIDAETPANLAK